jgi:hypothetical protein
MDVEMLRDQGWVFVWREHLMIEELRSFTSASKHRVSCQIPYEYGGTRFVPGFGARTHTQAHEYMRHRLYGSRQRTWRHVQTRNVNRITRGSLHQFEPSAIQPILWLDGTPTEVSAQHV